MTTILMIIATVWAGGALAFFAALCLAARRPMPAMEAFDDASQFYSSTNASLASATMGEAGGQILGSATALLAAKGNRA